MLQEYIITKCLDEFVSKVAFYLKDGNLRLEAPANDLHQYIADHTDTVLSWMDDISFKELRSPKSLESVYVDLDIQLTPRKWLPKEFAQKKEYILDIINRNFHLVILGDVGAGKTTTLKYICKNLFAVNNSDNIRYNFPLLIRLRDIEKEESLFEYIRKQLGIVISFRGKRSEDEKEQFLLVRKHNVLIQRATLDYIEELRPVILIDGFDEISYSKQKTIFSELSEMFLKTRSAKIILTSRSANYELSLPKSEVYEICSLNSKQIDKFVYNWLDHNKSDKKEFLEQLRNSPFNDTAIRPLTLAHICALYKKYKRIPDKPKSIYKRVVNLLIEDWDIQRGLVRTSAFADFDVDRKLEFLYNLAYQLTVETEVKVFDEDMLLRVFDKTYSNFSSEKHDRKTIIKEIEADTGILIKSSHDTYEFAHLSIQEYLAAEYIIRLPIIYDFDIATKNIMNELAIAVCLSSNPTIYFATLVSDNFISSNIDLTKINTFLKRLTLESPDFSSDLLTAVGVLMLYMNFFVLDIRTQPTASAQDEIYLQFWYSIIKKKTVVQALVVLKDFYVETKIDNGLVFLKFDNLKFRTGFNYPEYLIMKEDLYNI